MAGGEEKFQNSSDGTVEKMNDALGEKIPKAEAFKLIEEFKKNPEVNERVSEDIGMLQKLGLKLGAPMRKLAVAFSLYLVSQAGEARADEPKAGAKVEMQQVNLDQIKQRYQVPEEVEKLKEFESPVEYYLGVSQGIQEIIQNWKNLDETQRKQFFKALKDIPDGETYAKARDSEARLANMGNMQESAGVILQLQEISRYEPIQVAENGR